MLIASWNVNGIRAVLTKGALQNCIQQLDPDILCLQETKADAESIALAKELQKESVDFSKYHEFYNSAVKKGYSGTAIFTKQKPLNVINGFLPEVGGKYNFVDQHGDASSEGRVLSAEYDDFYVVTVYTPNSKRELTRLGLRQKCWDVAFLEHCKKLEEKKPVIFCGDLNVAHTEDDLANPKANVGEHGFTDEERAGFQKFLDAGFIDTFRMFTSGNGHYSWWTHWANARARNVGWRIDYFLVSSSLKDRIKKAAIHADIMGSDHCPVSIEL